MPKKLSAARKWCKVCKVWIADNRVQREQHEQARKHREALQTLLKEIADKNQQKAEREEIIQRTETRPSKTAAVTTAFLEQAASVTAKLLREESPADVDGSGGGEDERPDKTEYGKSGEKLLDANGYPLPASAIYGVWETVEDGNGREGHYDGTNEETGKDNARHSNSTAQESVLSADNDNEECITRTTEGEEVAEQNAVAHINFKRRIAPRTRRIRKKTRR